MKFVDEEHEDYRVTWKSATGFFISALAVFAVDLVYLLRSGRQPNVLVWGTLIVAAFGLPSSRIAWRDARRRETSELPPYLSAKVWSTIAIYTVFVAFYAATGQLENSAYNAHVLQAVAFLHGHAYIDAPPYIEHLDFGGHSYQLHPPLPAILLVPFAAIWGLRTNQTVFSLMFGALDVALAWRLLGRMQLSASARVWLVAFFGAGTTVWWETINAGSWDVTQVVAVGFTLAALAEIFGQCRPLVVGVLAGLASLARYDLGPEFPIYTALVYVRRRNWRVLFWMTPGFALAGAVFVAFNEVRYRSLFDITLFLMANRDHQRLFKLNYFVNNINTLLFLSPNFDDKFPFMHPRFAGQALTFTSPAFVLALRPTFMDATASLVGLGALLAMLPSLFFLWNGSAQFGTRHYVHAFPFLLVLMALGIPRRVDQLTKILIVASVALVAFGVWHMRVWGFGG